MATLRAATEVLATAGDSDYAVYARRSQVLAARRDALAIQMAQLLEAAAFAGERLDPARVQALVEESQALLGTKLL